MEGAGAGNRVGEGVGSALGRLVDWTSVTTIDSATEAKECVVAATSTEIFSTETLKAVAVARKVERNEEFVSFNAAEISLQIPIVRLVAKPDAADAFPVSEKLKSSSTSSRVKPTDMLLSISRRRLVRVAFTFVTWS